MTKNCFSLHKTRRFLLYMTRLVIGNNLLGGSLDHDKFAEDKGLAGSSLNM